MKELSLSTDFRILWRITGESKIQRRKTNWLLLSKWYST